MTTSREDAREPQESLDRCDFCGRPTPYANLSLVSESEFACQDCRWKVEPEKESTR